MGADDYYQIEQRRLRSWKRVAFVARIICWLAFLDFLYALLKGNLHNAISDILVLAAQLIVIRVANLEIFREY